jgi:pimeloyl-ACP methyl ester carboxylesterase
MLGIGAHTMTDHHRTYPATFRSQAGYDALAADYDRLLTERWSPTPESVMLPTPDGATHVLLAGDPAAPPLILLHGAMIHAGTLYDVAPALSQHFRLIAPDMPGQAGKTLYPRARHKGPEEIAWLTHVMDALEVERAHVAGLSLGGWLALMMGIHAPERVQRIVAIAPASFVGLNYQFLLRSIWAALRPTRDRIASVVRYMSAPTSPLNEDVIIGMQLVFKHLSPAQPVTRRFTDAELRSLTVPTLIMAGAYEVIYAAEKLMRRAKRLVPNVETVIIPDASHGILYEQPDAVINQITAFLARGA